MSETEPGGTTRSCVRPSRRAPAVGPRRHRSLAPLLIGVVAVGLAACGTRLGPDTFASASSGAAEPGGSGVPGGAGGATDAGVSASTITLGLIVSATSPLGGETFTAPMYGAEAYVQALNTAGGLAGRHVDLVVCDDQSTGAGNRRCASTLIDHDHVFAFIGNSIFDYAAASYVNDRGVPDVGGQPISTAYEQYAHLWSIYGSSSPRQGTVGLGGTLFGGTEIYHWFAQNLGTRTAAVVAYNQSDSLRFADLTAHALQVDGYSVVSEQVDFGLPAWNSVAIDMRAHGVDIVFDALDAAGNAGLCQAMDAAGLVVKAKVVTTQGWTDTVRNDYGSSPICRSELYAVGTTRNYRDTDNPTIAQFRADVHAAFPDRDDRLSMWELEGWASAQWFDDAVTWCGADVTRRCVEAYLARPQPYDGHGILTPRSFVPATTPPVIAPGCLFVARWRDSADDGVGGWVSATAHGDAVCYDVPQVAYTP